MIYDPENPDHCAELLRLAKEGGHTVTVDDGRGALVLHDLRPDGFLTGYVRGDADSMETGLRHSMLVRVGP